MGRAGVVCTHGADEREQPAFSICRFACMAMAKTWHKEKQGKKAIVWQSCKRTSALSRRWWNKIKMLQNGLEDIAGNNTRNTPYVQSKEKRAWMHKGRRQTDEQVIDNEKLNVLCEFEDAINKALNKYHDCICGDESR